MRKATFRSAHSRREFLITTTAAAAAALPSAPAWAAAKYTRYNVTTPQGRKMLASYAKGVEAMLKLPADDPRNWFRNAFIHLIDSPHGNWWFHPWHRGFLGYVETTIRALSGDPSFAMPYWDWTRSPRIPDSMLDGVLTPVDKAYAPYTRSLQVFTSFVKPAMAKYWSSLSAAQRAQLHVRGYDTLEDMWHAVTGNGVPGNMAFAVTRRARYVSRNPEPNVTISDPHLLGDTTYDVSPFVIRQGLGATTFYDAGVGKSFASSKTSSHNSPPRSFSVLEGLPHNNVHIDIGGAGILRFDPGPYGNMANPLSPVDPIFFLHHANMDRLWDVWARKQQRLHLPHLPPEAELKTLSDEPFLFYAGANGYVGPRTAGDVLGTDAFDYDYAPGGFSETALPRSPAALTAAPPIRGSVSGNSGSIVVPRATLQPHLTADAAAQALVLEISLNRPAGADAGRAFDVFVGAPDDRTLVRLRSLYYAGTVAFYGPAMPGIHDPTGATFAVPLPPTLWELEALGKGRGTALHVHVVPSEGFTALPVLTALSLGAY
jgi:tyrosinase